MLRMIGFFAGTLLLMNLLRGVPVVGAVFQIPLVGFFVAAFVLSLGLSKASGYLLQRRRFLAMARSLEAVDSPHNQGKLGTLLLHQGRSREALDYLERAVDGDPDELEWRYALGVAQLGARDDSAAVETLRAVAAEDEEYKYGAVQLRLGEALLSAGDAAGSLAAVELFERNHGPSPESAYRRGLAQKALGDRDAAGESFAEVGELAGRAAGFQRAQNRPWVWRAMLARF